MHMTPMCCDLLSEHEVNDTECESDRNLGRDAHYAGCHIRHTSLSEPGEP